MAKYLEFKNVSFNYFTKTGEVEALKDINFSIDENEFVSIVGPSGCGKSTLLSLISGLIKPISGEILLKGEKISGADIGYMFQKDHLFDWRTIYKNVTIGLEITGQHKNKERLEKVDNLLKKYGLYEFKNSYPSQLSGGMRQRASLIRTLAIEPKILLLDESFSALDFQTRLSVCDDVADIIEKEKQTAILVTHDISEAISMSDRVIILTKRPATVKKIQKIDLKSAGLPLKRREHKDFAKYFDIIWEELQSEK